MAEVADLGFYFDPARTRVDWDGPGTVVAANPEWRRRERTSIEADCAALPPLDGHIWIATSGSSATVAGRLRWVALSKGAFLASARAVNAHLAATPGDVWAHALPVFHVGGLGILARAALCGARVVPAVAGKWDAPAFHQRLVETAATLTALVPSQVHDLVAAGLPAPGSLRAVIVGGARLEPDLCIRARRLGWPCLRSYGLTETCSQVATAAVESGLSPTCDPVLPILAHAEISADPEGRLRVRAASLLTCYAEKTDAGVRTWDPKKDGWLETGDLGRVTAGGVEVLGRSAESVKVLGEVVSLLRIEEALRRWAAGAPLLAGAGADLAVVALPHDRLGHEIVAVLAAADRPRLEPMTARDIWPSLEAFSRDAFLPFERPRRVAWVDAIPRTPLGKTQRQLLARQVGLEPGADR